MGIRRQRSRVISILDGIPNADGTHHNSLNKTPNTGSIRFATCTLGGDNLSLFLTLPSGSLRGLRRIYMSLDVNHGAKQPSPNKPTSKNAEGAKSRSQLPGDMDDLPSPVVPEILSNMPYSLSL